jgi:hypothetical protein
VGSLGAGLSLAVAASVLLLVVSTVVAFRGWPDDLGSSKESVSRLAPAAEAGDATRSIDGAAQATPLALPSVTLTPTVRTRGSRPSHGGSGGGANSIVPGLSGGSAVSTQGASSPVPGGQAGETVNRTTTAGGDAVRETTKQAGQLVRPAAPAAGNTVEDTGSTVGGAIDKGDNAVAEALGQLSAP